VLGTISCTRFFVLMMAVEPIICCISLSDDNEIRSSGIAWKKMIYVKNI
jgi:hypothetical protein